MISEASSSPQLEQPEEDTSSKNKVISEASSSPQTKQPEENTFSKDEPIVEASIQKQLSNKKIQLRLTNSYLIPLRS